MADWKTPLNYNCNQPYHAFTYGVMYQLGPQQNHANQSGWSDPGAADMGGYNPGVTPANYNTAARGREEKTSLPALPPPPPPPGADSSGHYPGPGMLHLEGGQPCGIYLPRQYRAPYDTQGNDMKHARGDVPVHVSVAHTSPDSWSSASSREGSLPQVDPDKNVSSTVIEGPQNFTTGIKRETTTPVPGPSATPKTPSTAVNAVNTPKAKARIAFSEIQMNALVQRFSVQRYLTPSEMKHLAAMTGLTYKQVKTWFQNRRMKLRRYQKDSHRVDCYSINKNSPPCNAALFTNIPAHIQLYQGEARSQYQEPYNQQMRDVAAFKTSSQNLTYYLAAMGAPGSASYQSWPSTPVPSTSAVRPQATNWPMTSAINHYEYNPAAYSATTVTIVESTSMNETNLASKDEDPGHVRSSLQMAIAQNQNASQ
ncbi:homeobox protein NANOG [Lampris incognitus]|uniref:homeobox protein NANOG n=1 Tax=Lampris incognitus TaxID=2546036 RepID=UPI0024B51691|nr:homeobox protein NANOG [Lampris incognitus]